MDPVNDSSRSRMAFGILRQLRPHRLEGVGKVRLGRYFDGGYVMADAFDEVSAAYSLGINDDVSWDLDIARRGIPVFQYDHTIQRLPQTHPLFTWNKVGVGPSGCADPALWTLPELLRQNGHEEDDALILKCDVEGAEWEVLADVANPVLRQFRQIVLELHDMGAIINIDTANRTRRAIDNLTASHKVIHVHANNYGSYGLVAGIPVPDVLEVTLVRSDLGRLVVSDETFPTPLDTPNNSNAHDFYLGRFAFD